jgi:hypothetical protein
VIASKRNVLNLSQNRLFVSVIVVRNAPRVVVTGVLEAAIDEKALLEDLAVIRNVVLDQQRAVALTLDRPNRKALEMDYRGGIRHFRLVIQRREMPVLKFVMELVRVELAVVAGPLRRLQSVQVVQRRELGRDGNCDDE